jgi:hypothetical protein
MAATASKVARFLKFRNPSILSFQRDLWLKNHKANSQRAIFYFLQDGDNN